MRAQISAAQQGAQRQRDRVTGLLEAVEFTQQATDAVKLARKSGKTACLTLIEICGEAELKNMLGAERSEALLGEIGAQLKLHAIDHDSAGRVGDGKFSVTHLESESPAAIANAIAKAGQSYNLDEKALNLHETTVRFHGNSLSRGGRRRHPHLHRRQVHQPKAPPAWNPARRTSICARRPRRS